MRKANSKQRHTIEKLTETQVTQIQSIKDSTLKYQSSDCFSYEYRKEILHSTVRVNTSPKDGAWQEWRSIIWNDDFLGIQVLCVPTESDIQLGMNPELVFSILETGTGNMDYSGIYPSAINSPETLIDAAENLLQLLQIENSQGTAVNEQQV